VDQGIKKYAQELHHQREGESRLTMDRDKIAFLNRVGAQGRPANLSMSGVEFQANVRFHAEHIERSMKSFLDSYQKAFAQVDAIPTDSELREIWNEIRESKEHLIKVGGQAIRRQFSASTPDINPFEALTAETGHGHDRVLQEWKVWRAQILLIASTLNKNINAAHDLTNHRSFEIVAIEEARKSVSEDRRPHPLVGAVIVKNGHILSKAHRGEKLKSHAEFTALEDKLRDEPIAGATVYTTLEPCTTRKSPKIPCAQRLVDRKVERVFIGMLDPNPDIRGLGVQLLNEAGIETQLFPRDLTAQIEELNRDFIRDQKQRHASRETHDTITVATTAARSLSDATWCLQKAAWSFYELHTQYGVARAARDIENDERTVIAKIDAAYTVFTQDYDLPSDLSAVAKDELSRINIALINMKSFSLTGQGSEMKVAAAQVQEACERIRAAARPIAYKTASKTAIGGGLREQREGHDAKVTAADWKDVATRFQNVPNDASRADWTRTSCEGKEVDANWRVVGGANGCEQLCTLAGAMLLKSRNICSGLPADILSQANDIWRWLYYIKDNVWLKKRVMHGTGVDGDKHYLTLMESIESLANNSARACIECAAREL
jgi:pyrimidine deaminase RibD-like protein